MGNATTSAKRARAGGRAAIPAPVPAGAPADALLAEGAPGEELAARLRIAVTRLNRRLRQESLAGVSPAQASTLGTINRLGHPTLGELAVVEQVQPPTMTRLVGSLEAAGLVARHADKDDGRIVRVEVTAGGRRSLEHMRTLKNAFLSRGLAALGDEDRAAAARLTALLEQLVGAP